MTSVKRFVIHPVGIIKDARNETLEGVPVQVFFVTKPRSCLTIPALQLFEQSLFVISANQFLCVSDPILFFDITKLRHDTNAVLPCFLILGTVVANELTGVIHQANVVIGNVLRKLTLHFRHQLCVRLSGEHTVP